MNRQIFSFLPILPLAGTPVVGAQTHPLPAPQANSIVESSRISRFVPGPGDRPQGLLLRSGTFVNLSPGLSQQLPASLEKNAPVLVSGDLLTYDGNKTIEAHNITIAGVAYSESVGGPAVGAAVPAPPPPPAVGRSVGGQAGPPPPPPCAAGGPPPPARIEPGAPPPPSNGATTPPPPPATEVPAGTPPPPAPDRAAPAPPVPAPAPPQSNE